MTIPTLQVELASGRIERIICDLRLYAVLARIADAPALEHVLKHTRAINILPTGEQADMTKTVEETPVVWFLDTEPGLVSDNDYYWLKRPSPDIKIGIRIEKAADRANPRINQVSIDVLCPGDPSLAEDILRELGAGAELAECAVRIPALYGETSYLSNTIVLADHVRDLRVRKEKFIAAIVSTPIEGDEE